MKNREKADKHLLYVNALQRITEENIIGMRKESDIVKSIILYGIKIFNGRTRDIPLNPVQLESYFQFAETIKSVISSVTPREFERIFPIDKEFDGHKLGYRDYFYTKEYLKTIDLDESIGEKIIDFLFYYNNSEVYTFISGGLEIMAIQMTDIAISNHYEI